MGVAEFDVRILAIPSVCLLVSFLAYSSQVLFLYLDPRPLSQPELLKFNSLVVCIWVCYARACCTNPGNVPPAWKQQALSDGTKPEDMSEAGTIRSRWCRKCEVMKPPRAHHCKTCRRLVFLMPSMVSTDYLITDAFPKWTITVRGQAIVSRTLPFPISFDFFFMLWRQ